MTHTVRVNLAERSYDVVVGACGGAMGALVKAACPGAAKYVVVIDPAIAGTHGATALRGLAASGIGVHVVKSVPEATEANKSLATVEHLCSQFASIGLDRRDVVVAVGGGIIGDLSGFAAAVYRRGVAWVSVPTTLLSMVDASVGGKTGANLFTRGGTLKNMVGAFHQPSLVAVDPRWLATLPARHVRCGMAECIKHALLCRSAGARRDASLFDFTSGIVERRVDLSRDEATAADFIVRNVALKARVVQQDERETAPDASGGRALLNLGHTFAHVLEGLGVGAHDGGLMHGEAVGLGLISASHTARAMGRVSAEYVAMVTGLVRGVGLPTSIAGTPSSEQLTALMHGDKKTLGGRLRLVLPHEPVPGEIGHALVVADPDRAAVVAGWESIRPQ
jgi:3-dehydroquinate synthase